MTSHRLTTPSSGGARSDRLLGEDNWEDSARLPGERIAVNAFDDEEVAHATADLIHARVHHQALARQTAPDTTRRGEKGDDYDLEGDPRYHELLALPLLAPWPRARQGFAARRG
jgi:hypothetical protein